MSSSSSTSSSTSTSSSSSSSMTQFLSTLSQYPSDDPRLGDMIRRVSVDELTTSQTISQPTVIFLGFPYDEGCRRNGGRVGAAEGPSAWRKLGSRVGTIYNAEYNVDLSALAILDVGDITPALELEQAHQQLTQTVFALMQMQQQQQQQTDKKHMPIIPFVLGGSNDQSCSNALALLKYMTHTYTTTSPSIGVVNIDAHLDVRPRKDGKVHSGSPFREMIESELWQTYNNQSASEQKETQNAESPFTALAQQRCRFVEFAAQGNQCSAAHVEYLQQKKYPIVWLSQLRASKVGVAEEFKKVIDSLGDHVFISFDIDSISGADCPGVSCPASIGLTAQEALDMCFIAGQHPNVRLFDLSEFNPKIDEYRTTRLVANMFYFFCMGVAKRMQNQKK